MLAAIGGVFVALPLFSLHRVTRDDNGTLVQLGFGSMLSGAKPTKRLELWQIPLGSVAAGMFLFGFMPAAIALFPDEMIEWATKGNPEKEAEKEQMKTAMRYRHLGVVPMHYMFFFEALYCACRTGVQMCLLLDLAFKHP